MTTAVQLQNYLDEKLIVLNLAISSPKKLLQEMAKLLSTPLNECKEKTIYHCLLEREKLGNTGIGNGIAIPHGRSDETDQAVLTLVTLETAIDYDSQDKQPVDLAFGLLVPQEATEEHLKILAEIARNMSNENNKQQLLSAANPKQVIEIISKW